MMSRLAAAGLGPAGSVDADRSGTTSSNAARKAVATAESADPSSATLPVSSTANSTPFTLRMRCDLSLQSAWEPAGNHQMWRKYALPGGAEWRHLHGGIWPQVLRRSGENRNTLSPCRMARVLPVDDGSLHVA